MPGMTVVRSRGAVRPERATRDVVEAPRAAARRLQTAPPRPAARRVAEVAQLSVAQPERAELRHVAESRGAAAPLSGAASLDEEGSRRPAEPFRRVRWFHLPRGVTPSSSLHSASLEHIRPPGRGRPGERLSRSRPSRGSPPVSPISWPGGAYSWRWIFEYWTVTVAGFFSTGLGRSSPQEQAPLETFDLVVRSWGLAVDPQTAPWESGGSVGVGPEAGLDAIDGRAEGCSCR
jgi:hypothetical protein